MLKVLSVKKMKVLKLFLLFVFGFMSVFSFQNPNIVLASISNTDVWVTDSLTDVWTTSVKPSNASNNCINKIYIWEM